MGSKFALTCGFISLLAVSMAYSDEYAGEDAAPPIAEPTGEIAWGFGSKSKAINPKVAAMKSDSDKEEKDKSAMNGENGSVRNYNDITKKGGWVTAEFIYWKPSVSGIPTGLKVETTNAFLLPGNNGSLSIKEHHISYDFHPGFRVGLGCRLPYDKWDLYSQWTQLNAHGRKTIRAIDGKSLVTVWVPSTPSFGSPSSIRAKGDLSLRIADLELGKVFYPTRPFSLRPSIGARGLWLDQGVKLEYTDIVINFGGPGPVTGNDHLHIKNQYQAGGLRGALTAGWNFKEGWAFYGKTGFSLLWGKFKASIHENFLGQQAATATDIDQPFKETNNFNAMKSVFDVTAGLSWTKVFSQKMRLSLNAGYEFNYFPNQEEIKLYANPGTQGAAFPLKQTGDLAFQGVTVGGRFDF